MTSAEEWTIDNESCRMALINELKSRGYEASMWDSGGGILFVTIPVKVAEPGSLAVVAGSNGAPCEVGLVSPDQSRSIEFEFIKTESLPSTAQEMIRLASKFTQNAV